MYNFYLRRKALDEQHIRRQSSATYTEPLQMSPMTEKFISEFADKIRQREQINFYSGEQAKYPDLKLHFEMLVPSEVSYEEFWRRYEHRTDLNRIMEELKQGSASRTSWGSVAGKKPQILPRKRFNRPQRTNDAHLRHDDNDASSEDLEEGTTAETARVLSESEEEPTTTEEIHGDHEILQEIDSASESDDSDFEGTGIHVYSDNLEDEDTVVNDLNMRLSASEFDTEGIDDLDDLDLEPDIHVDPETIGGGNVGVKAVIRNSIEGRIHDDELGSLEYDDEYGSLEYDDKHGSIASITAPITNPAEINEDAQTLEKVYHDEDEIYQDDDRSDEDDKCNCACVIS